MSTGQFETAATLPPSALPDESMDYQVGRIVDGRYRLVEKLGEGGMGAVFVAEHLTLRKQVALKTIHSTFDGHAEIAARFAREAMASARIEHPHVVSALDYGTVAGRGAYLVMQLVRGEGLRRRLERDGSLPWRLACEIIEQMADAVAAAHAVGIVHRDLKPENVVLEPSVGENLHVKVLDFGIAHLRMDRVDTQTIAPGAPLTRVGAVMGTPGYMAPEQAVGQPVDERTDVYALGVMLWELIAGRRPFDGKNLTEIVTKQFVPEPPGLPLDGQLVPEGLSGYLRQMLASRPEGRPATAAEVRDRMRKLRELSEPTPVKGPEPSSPRNIQNEFWAPPRRRHALAAAFVLFLVFALWSVFSGGGDEDLASTSEPTSAQSSVQGRKTARMRDSRERESSAAEPSKGDERRESSRAEKATPERDNARGRRDGSENGKGRNRIRRALDSLFR